MVEVSFTEKEAKLVGKHLKEKWDHPQTPGDTGLRREPASAKPVRPVVPSVNRRKAGGAGVQRAGKGQDKCGCAQTM